MIDAPRDVFTIHYQDSAQFESNMKNVHTMPYSKSSNSTSVRVSNHTC